MSAVATMNFDITAQLGLTDKQVASQRTAEQWERSAADADADAARYEEGPIADCRRADATFCRRMAAIARSERRS